MKSLLVILSILIISTLSFARNKNIDSTLTRHGIQFQLPDILRLSNYNGYAFSYRYKKDKTSEYRFGIAINLRNEDTDETAQYDTTLTNTVINTENYYIKLSVQYLRRIVSHGNFSFITGGGPFVTYQYNNNSSNKIYMETITKDENNSHGYGFGLDALAGVEFQAYKNIVISGEYGLTAIWTFSDFENKHWFFDNNNSAHKITSDKTTGTRNRFYLIGGRVILGITIYF